MTGQHQYSLRLTLTSILVGLVLLGTLGIVGVILLVRRRSVEATAAALAREASRAIEATTRDRLGGAESVLRECANAADLGLLPLDDPVALARRLAVRLRDDLRFESLIWLAEGASAGAAAAHRPDGTLLVLWTEQVAAGDPAIRAETWAPDGSRTPNDMQLPSLKALQVVDWYTVGARSDQPAWTERFRRPIDGTYGRACALGFRRGGALVGVFSIGIGEAFISAALGRVVVGTTGGLLLLDPVSGEVRNAASAEAAARLGSPVREAVAGLAGGLGSLEGGEPVVRAVSAGGTAWTVALVPRNLGGPMRWVDAVVAPRAELVGYLDRYLWVGLAAVGVVIALSLLVGMVAASRISRPLRAIAEDLRRVGSFELSQADPVRSAVREVATLSDDTSRMKRSLQSFGRYVPTALVRDLLSQGGEARLGGAVRPLTLFFSDVEGFTTASEGKPPQAVVEALGDYLAALVAEITAAGGTVDKFVGDGVVAFFNAPRDDVRHPESACRAALGVQAALAKAQPAWTAVGRPAFRTRIGLHTAEVVVGNIGTPERFAYTVIGDGVNLAARLESLNKSYGTWILVSRETREAAGDAFLWRRLDRAAVAGRAGGDDVYELLGLAGEVDARVLAARDVYERAFTAYLARRFEEAARGFEEAAGMRPGDQAAKALAARAREYAGTPPPVDWTGVYAHTKK